MREPRFPIFGADIPPMLGRASIMQRIWNALTKPTPSNLSMIGPRCVGKTVIMHALAQRVASDASPYQFVLYWHLGHVAPTSDRDFIAQLCDKLCHSLARSPGDTSEYQEYLRDLSFRNLSEVAESLDEEGRPILMLWDGFDKPLGQGQLTGHLWDQMRTIFYGRKHKIVTASRKPLSQLIRSQEAGDSPFWNIFDVSPVRIGAFDEQDREAILGLLLNHSFRMGAKTEMLNWSAGLPPLFLGILNRIAADIPSGPVDNEKVSESMGGSDADLQTGLYAWAMCQHPKWRVERPEDCELVEVQLLTQDVVRHRATEEIFDRLENRIYRSVNMIQSLRLGRKYDLADIEEYDFAGNPNSCSYCPQCELCRQSAANNGSGAPDIEPKANGSKKKERSHVEARPQLL